MQYRADIDGLRALAVIAVAFFHGDIHGFEGGFTGVDVFFVISGFLITKLITDDIEAKRFSLLKFYERRARRILPALFVVIAVSTILAALLLAPRSMAEFGKSAFAATLFSSNILFFRQGGYFQLPTDQKPLLNTWSLGVEEQFYLVLPLFLLIVFRLGRRYLPFAIAALFCGSFALNLVYIDTHPRAVFYLTPFRLWELLMGSTLAINVIPKAQKQWLLEGLAIVGIVMVSWSVTSLDRGMEFPGWNALFPTIGSGLIIYSGTQSKTVVSRLLSVRPLVLIGLTSYSFYLWHWPIIVFARYALIRDLSTGETITALLGSAGVAWLSWRWIERPWRGSSASLVTRKFVTLFGALACIIAGFGLWAHYSQGWQERRPNYVDVYQWNGKSSRIGSCLLRAHQTFDEWPGIACTMERGQKKNLLLWGDSFAAHYAPGFRKNGLSVQHNVVQYTKSRCPPILSYASEKLPMCGPFNKNIFTVINDYEIDVVVMAAAWASTSRYLDYKLEDIRPTVRQIRNMGLDVIVIGQSPMFETTVDHIAFGASARTEARLDHDYSFNFSLGAHIADADFFDPTQYLCSGAYCKIRDESAYLFTDHGHFSERGSHHMVDALLKAFPTL